LPSAIFVTAVVRPKRVVRAIFFFMAAVEKSFIVSDCKELLSFRSLVGLPADLLF